MRGISHLRRAEHVLLFELEDVKYVASYRVKCPPAPEWPSRALVTVLPTESSTSPSQDHLLAYVNHALQHDDVFRTEFLANMLHLDWPSTTDATYQTVRHLAMSHGSNRLSLKSRPHQMTRLAPGPYLIAEGSLWQVSRLYDDVQGAFMIGVEPPNVERSDSMVYTHLRIAGAQYQTLSIAAPSRAASYTNGSLDGMRMAVKDMFDVNGLTTTLCNRAFYEINTPSTSTAACVKRLIDAGVHVLGTTKISSMISREEPTEAIDYHAPFNPRADGYQSPAGSSSGSAAATAAYEWLDFTIAEDTSGSGRRPAAANGCFEYRPTHDLVDLKGMWPTFVQFDTPVILSRDLIKIASIAPLWCSIDSSINAAASPKPLSIVYPEDFLPKDDKEHLQYLDSFVEDLKSSTTGTVEKVYITQKWHDSCPKGCEGQVLTEYLSDVIVRTFYYHFYHSQASFRDKYFRKYQKEPYVNSFVKWRWNLGKKVTQEQHQEGLRRLEVYKSWFLKEVMGGPEKNSILVMPISEGVPNYRDHPPNRPAVQNGFDPLFLSPILGCPDLVVPIAQMKYESRVSGRTEKLPICVNLLGALGRDADLISVVQATLQASDRPCAVRAGSEMF